MFVVGAQPDWAYEFSDRTGPDTQILQNWSIFVNQENLKFSKFTRFWTKADYCQWLLCQFEFQSENLRAE